MNTILTAKDLFEAQRTPLKLKWLAGESGGGRLLEPATAKFPGMALVGHLNFVHPNRVQVLGSAEVEYLKKLDKTHRRQTISELASCPTTAIIVLANNEKVPAELRLAAEAAALPVLASPLPSPRVIDRLQSYLSQALAAHTTLHGVYMEVMGVGVLLTGESGMGKSELALELLSRNHRLIADDAVEFYRTGPDILMGRAPELLSGFLEVRGLGILNVRAMFGDTTIRTCKTLRLILRMEQMKKTRMSRIDRLQATQKTRNILDVEIPEVVLYVAPGRNLAVLVEAATRSHILQMRGVNPLQDLIARQEALMQGKKK
jgi:HPr kinase/phosphorylase